VASEKRGAREASLAEFSRFRDVNPIKKKSFLVHR